MLDLTQLTADSVLLFDGAMGTMLQRAGLPAGALPETYNITHPQVVTDIHRAYVQAGSRVVSTNTFQANPYKLADCGYSLEEIIAAAIACAKASGAAYTALDIGPLGQLLEPMGTVTFEEAYALFRQQAILGEKHGADMVLLETFSDLYEMKAAVLAVKENTDLPVIASMTYQEDGRTFVGCDPVSAAIMLSGLGVAALGVNCSLGPAELEPVVEELLRYARVPVIVQANAGLPQIQNGETITPSHRRNTPSR
jgi:5-methyltetrahydrofolate--homocysteine methyltransferase